MSLVFGLVRFSYVPEDPIGFVLTRDKSYEERLRLVHDPKRLERRFRLFEAVCLPSLAAQPADRFTGVILTSETLPEPFASRLKALTEPYPNIHAVFMPPMRTRGAFAEALGRFPAADSTRLTFRLDDDDAVSAGYTDHVERYRQPRYHGHCVTLYDGLGLCRLYGRTRLWSLRYFLSSAGLAFVGDAGVAETVYDCGNHTRVPEKYPTLADATAGMFLQTSHGSNDSGSRVPILSRLRPSRLMTQEAAAEAYGDRFPFLAGTDFRFVEAADFQVR